MNRGLLRRLGVGLIVVIGAGLLIGTWYVDRKEQKKVQASVQNLQQEDKLDMKKMELESQDQEWQRKLEKKKNGNTDVVIVADNIARSLYQTVYPRMQEMSWQGVMVLSDGEIPGKQPDTMSRDQFEEMLENGWNYAFGVSEPLEDEGDISAWMQAFDQAVTKWEDAGIDNPGIAVCQTGQFSEAIKNAMKQELQSRGFRALFVICENDSDRAGAFDESWNELESVLLRQDYSNVTTLMNEAMGEGKSMSVTLGLVTEEPQDTSRELTPEKFEQFLSQMQDMQENGYHVLSYTDYESDRKASNEELAQVQKEYEIFLQEKEQKIKELEGGSTHDN